MTIDWSDASGCRVGSCEPPVGLPTSWLAPSGLSRSVSLLFRDRSEYPVLRCRFPEGWRQSGLPEWAADVGSCGPSENPNAVSLNVALVSLSPELRASLGALSVASPILSTMNRTPHGAACSQAIAREFVKTPFDSSRDHHQISRWGGL